MLFFGPQYKKKDWFSVYECFEKSLDTILRKDNLIRRKNISLPLLTIKKRHLAPSRSYVFTYEHVFFKPFKSTSEAVIMVNAIGREKDEIGNGQGTEEMTNIRLIW